MREGVAQKPVTHRVKVVMTRKSLWGRQIVPTLMKDNVCHVTEQLHVLRICFKMLRR